MLPDKVLASLSFEGSVEDGEHKVLFKLKEGLVGGSLRRVGGVEDFSNTKGVSQRQGVALPTVPLVFMLHDAEQRGVTFDAALEVKDGVPLQGSRGWDTVLNNGRPVLAKAEGVEVISCEGIELVWCVHPLGGVCTVPPMHKALEAKDNAPER